MSSHSLATGPSSTQCWSLQRREGEDQRLRALIEKKTSQVSERLEHKILELQGSIQEAFENVQRELGSLASAVQKEGETRQKGP